MKKSLFNNALLTIIALVSLGLTKLIFNISIGRAFGASVLGAVSIALSLTFLLVPISSVVCSATTKYLAEYRGRNDQSNVKATFTVSLLINLILSLLFSVICIIFSKQIVKIQNIPYNLIFVPVILIPLYTLYLFFRSSYYGINEVKQYLKVELLGGLIFFVSLALVTLYLKKILILPFILMYLVFVVISSYFFKSYLKLDSIKPEKKELHKKICKYSLFQLVTNITDAGRQNLGILILGLYVSSSYVGYYAAIFSIMMVLFVVDRLTEKVLFPSFSFNYGKNALTSIKRVLNLSTKYSLIVILPLAGTAILASSKIINILFGDEFKVASIALQILFISAVIRVAANPSIIALSSTRYIKLETKARIFSFIIAIISWFLLVPRKDILGGINGAAIGLCLSSIVLSLYCIYYSRKYFGLELANFRIIYRVIMILVVSYPLKYVVPFDAVIISSVIFSLLFMIINRKELKELFYYIRSRVSFRELPHK